MEGKKACLSWGELLKYIYSYILPALAKSCFQCGHSTTTLPALATPWMLLRIISYAEDRAKMFIHVSHSPFHLHWPARSGFCTKAASSWHCGGEKAVDGSPASRIPPEHGDVRDLITKYCRNLEMQDLIWKNSTALLLLFSISATELHHKTCFRSSPCSIMQLGKFLVLPLGRFCFKFSSSNFLCFNSEFRTKMGVHLSKDKD